LREGSARWGWAMTAERRAEANRRGVALDGAEGSSLSVLVRFGNKIIYLRGRQQPPAPPFGTFRNTVPARTVRNVPAEHTA
jgi:hypothetical protein